MPARTRAPESDSGSPDGSVADGGPAGVATGTEAMRASTAGVDAGLDAGIDAGLDAGFDAGIDAGVDSTDGTSQCLPVTGRTSDGSRSPYRAGLDAQRDLGKWPR